MKLRMSRPLRLVGILACIIALGLLSGAYFGNWIRSARDAATEAEHRLLKEQLTQKIIERASGLEIGSRLTDLNISTLQGEPVLLSDAIVDRGLTWVSLIEPNCDVCLQHISNLASVIKDESSAAHFVFVSSANPGQLTDLSRLSKIASLFLSDANGTAAANYNVNAFPFHMLIDKQLVLKQMAIGVLTDEQISLATD